MGQGTAGIKGCITIKIKEEDRWDLTIKIKEEDRRADFKKARDGLGVVIREKEAALNTKETGSDAFSSYAKKQLFFDVLFIGELTRFTWDMNEADD